MGGGGEPSSEIKDNLKEQMKISNKGNHHKPTIVLYFGATYPKEGAQLYSFSNLLYGLSDSWRRPAKQNKTAFIIYHKHCLGLC